MALTEEEVATLADKVGEVDLGDPEVQAWVQENLVQLRKQEKQNRANFKLQRFLRNDEAMQKVAEELRRLRALIDALTAMVRPVATGRS